MSSVPTCHFVFGLFVWLWFYEECRWSSVR